ncbi:MAG TPA: BtrH N-terminal domain-containing protein [Pseudomonadales bacterium]
MNPEFQHRQAAHCESGVVSALMRHHGLDISEPMAMGLSSAMTFAYIPLVKLNGLPLIAYRMPPRHILRGIQKQLGVRFRFRKFRDPALGMQALDNKLAEGSLVGLQGSVFWLPYFPEDMRFHFNAHNLLVYGKQGNDYLISDPIFEHSVTAAAAELQKARFAKGALAAKGLMYWVESMPQQPDLPTAIRKSIRQNARVMLKTPLPIIGIRGIRFLAGKVARLDQTLQNPKKIKLYLGHIIRMQEEIGTGGGGFRFIYASFLQEAAAILGDARLLEASRMMTDAGDLWRRFALETTRMCKGKNNLDLPALAALMNQCADAEAACWQYLAKHID